MENNSSFMEKFTVNTHHAYLNNEIVIRSDEPICIKDENTGNSYDVSGELSIHLSAGEHCLKSEGHEEHVFIEDAIKLGGSTIKYAFVFDDSPWVFVTTKDRLYIYNRETKEERVEYNVTPDEIKEEFGNDIDFKNVVIEVNSFYGISKEKEGDVIASVLDKSEKLLGKSESGNLLITRDENKLYLRDVKKDSKEEILSHCFDSSVYTNAYFSSDGKNVVLQKSKTEVSLLGLEDFKLNPFEIDGFNIDRYEGCNGYKPEITFLAERIPVWRDPITLKTVHPEEMSKHIFMSPDGKYSADLHEKTKYFNRLTKKEITSEELIELRKKYNWDSETDEEEKKRKVELRKQLAENSDREELFGKIIERYSKREITSEDEKEMINKFINEQIDRYINKVPDFIDLFIDRLGYICYKENRENSKSKEILIGRNVHFINYISFSYDSRYLSFAAKMLVDAFRSSQEGVFVLYDMEKEEVVRRIERYNDGQLEAVWMTMFNKNGDVAFYEGWDNAYLLKNSSGYSETYVARGKILLCFSPSGKYVALSDRNYIDLYNYLGHPSFGKVFIHPTDDFNTCLEHYNDFANGIDGIACYAGCVASAAFSQDEKRLLAVGNDGVVVIRNLHLENK